MTKYIIIPAVALLGVCGHLFAQGFEQTDLREWTSSTGQKVKAEYESYRAGIVLLKTVDGKFIKIPISGLSRADQAFVKEQAGLAPSSVKKTASASSGGPAKGSGAVVSKDETLLPYFEGESWEVQRWSHEKNMFEKPETHQTHAVYDGRTYRAVIDENAEMFIFPKGHQEGEFRIVNPIRFFFHIHGKFHYQNDQNQGRRQRNVVHYIEPPAPSRDPKKLHFKSVHEDDSERELILEFSPDEVEITGCIRDAKAMEDSSDYQFGFRLLRSFKFENDTPVAEQIKACKGADLVIEGPDGKIERNYSDSARFAGQCEKVTDTGHWKGRTLIFDFSEVQLHKPSANSYPGLPPHCGYHMYAGRSVALPAGGRRKKGKGGMIEYKPIHLSLEIK